MSVRIGAGSIAALVGVLCFAALAACGRAGPPVRSRPAAPPAAAAPAGLPVQPVLEPEQAAPEPAQAAPDSEEKQP